MTAARQALHEVSSAQAYREQAREYLPADVWAYLDYAAGQGGTRRANRLALEEAALIPRMLADVRGGHTRIELLGQRFDHPLLLAPIAYQRLFHEQGEVGSLLAAASQGGTMIVSTLASQTLEEIASVLEPDSPRPWFQLYWLGREATRALVQRAEAAGYTVLVLTVDAPVKAAHFELPDGVRAANLSLPLSPAPIQLGQSTVFDGWMAKAPTWDDLAWLCDETRLPLLLKGILHEEDARLAIEHGVGGIIVSNHGGRVLDGVQASLACLPKVIDRVGGKVPVLFDSGIRSGMDAMKAINLGAAAVLIGRPYIWGLAKAGAMGVAHVIRLMRDELELAMALTGQRAL